MPENNENGSSGLLDGFVKLVTRTDLNRIGRAKFITASFIFSLVLSLISSPLAYLGSMFDKVLSYPVISISISVIMIAMTVYGTVVINNKRFHDFGKSGWWQLLLLVPLVNIVMMFIMCLVPGDKEDNQYGSASETTTFEKVCAWLLPILVAIVICGLFATALLPRIKYAQDVSYDTTRIADLNSLQSSILSVYNQKGEYPLTSESSDGIAASELSSILDSYELYNSYSDPIDISSTNSGLGNATSKGDYLYMVTTKNTIPGGGFVLLSLAGGDSNANWVVCDNGEGNIPAGYDIRDFKVCSSVNKGNSCSNDFKGNCTYSSKDELRYILTF